MHQTKSFVSNEDGEISENDNIILFNYLRYIFIGRKFFGDRVETIAIIPNVNNKSKEDSKRCTYCEAFIRLKNRFTKAQWIENCNTYGKCQKNMIRGESKTNLTITFFSK